jgi:hypothetical protein
MKPAGSAILALLLLQDPVCDHGSRGASRPVDLAAVARLHSELAREAGSFASPPPEGGSIPGFDSGLPSCRARTTRRMRVESLPPDMKPLYFAPAGRRVPEGALHVVTRARSLADVSLPADRELSARFGVRCAPTLVLPVTATTVELTEGGSP